MTHPLSEKIRDRETYVLGGPSLLMSLCGQAADELDRQSAEIATLTAEVERLRDRTPITSAEPAWSRINGLFEKHNLPPPPTRLRDELTAHLIAHDRCGGYQP